MFFSTVTTTGLAHLIATCTNDTISVNTVGDIHYAFEIKYNCSSTTGYILFQTNSYGEEKLSKGINVPPGSKCAVFGCYVAEEIGSARLFNTGYCTVGEKIEL